MRPEKPTPSRNCGGPARGGGGPFGSPATTACTWHVRRGSIIADAELQDTQPAVLRSATVAQPAAASCALDGDRPTGSLLGIGAYYIQRHVDDMSAEDCLQRGMQPGHPESRAGSQTAASVDPMRWAQSVLRNCPSSQGKRSWPTFDTPPWHPSHHTSP